MSTKEELNKNTEIMKKACTTQGGLILIEMLEVKASATYHGYEIDYDKGMTKSELPLYVPQNILDEQRKREKVGQVYGVVVQKGKDCYNRQFFDTEHQWCEVGDIIRIAQYGGDNVKTPNCLPTKLRFINDKDVLATYDRKTLEDSGLLESSTIDYKD